MSPIALCLLLVLSAWASRFEVKSLPGWDGQLPSRIWSGFCDAGIPPAFPQGKIHMHYVYVEALQNPSTAPVLFWYNGGPGASSLFGLFVELGPLMLNDLSLQNPKFNQTGIPQLIFNPYSWASVANILVVDNPAPVGFSYCDPIGPTGNGTSCGPWNDTSVANANYQFLVNWFKDFPEFHKNDLYIVGESYAGIYVPNLAQKVIEGSVPMNLKGFAVGDGCMGTEVLCGGGKGPYWSIEFFHGHGQFSNQLYHQISNECSEQSLKTGRNITPRCQALLNDMNDEIGGYYAYNLYDDCVGRNIFLKSTMLSNSSLGEALNDYPCPGPAMNMWLNRSDVRRALSVPVDSYFFSEDNGVGFNYTLTEKNVLPFYLHAITKTNLRVLVYNGDTDPGINSFITQDIYFDFLDQHQIPKLQRWRPWTLDGKVRMGGYVTRFHKFDFLTIRGSGHMVPEFKPEASLAFLKAWLKNEDYPRYRPSTQ